MGEAGLLRAEVVGMVVHDEAVVRREVYLVSWSEVSVRGGAGLAMLRGRRKGVVMTPDGSVLFTVAVSGIWDLGGGREDDCEGSGIADPFACFSSSIGGAGAAMLKAGGGRQCRMAMGCNWYIPYKIVEAATVPISAVLYEIGYERMMAFSKFSALRTPHSSPKL